jgi:sulfur relay (sulfurtransferase) DsrC/TusE family protein
LHGNGEGGENPAAWNHDVAIELALKVGIATITDEQWKILRYVREH